MNGISLCPRLQMAADFVRAGVSVADIGTDHAYLSAYLVMTGKCRRATASDLRAQPLENAKQTIRRYHLEGRITTCLSDGLDAINPGEAEDIVLAGMGGELIASLLARTPWLRDEQKQLILQPMTHAEDVRRFLYKNGFAILAENAVREDEHLYIALCARYTGETTACSPGLPYLGRLPACGGEAAMCFLEKQRQRLAVRAQALRRANREPEECARLEAAAVELSAALESMHKRQEDVK